MAVGLALTALWCAALGRDRGGVATALTLAALVLVDLELLALLLLAGLILVALDAMRSRRGVVRVGIPWASVTRPLNTVLVVLLLLQAGRAALVRLEVPTPQPAAWDLPAGTDKPDVFLILLDGHARADVLQSSYGYDMAELRDVLTNAGFEESPGSFANHAVTRFSLAVLLNGRPIEDLGQSHSLPADDKVGFGAMLRSDGISMLERAGYETVVISSGFDHLPLRSVDRFIDVGPRNELEQVLIDTTAVARTLDRLANGYVTSGRDRVLAELDALRDIASAQGEGPQFVLAHLPAPHFPMVVEGDCTIRLPDKYTQRSFGSGWEKGDATAYRVYADQVRCLDGLVAPVIDDLVSHRPGAVVIVLSDHGPEEGIDWRRPDAQGTQERLANLFWARTPGRSGVFPDDVTLVNVLPILANAYLGTSGKLHPNDLYLSGPHEAVKYFTRFDPATTSAEGRRPLPTQRFRCPGVSCRSCPPRT